tara:strand:+ start:406 stop:1554 length:1149 start_codon:yes stop_codon:yes gene_type:complete
MRCLVTGGAGFIGSALVDELIKQGHMVSIVDDLSTGKMENVNPKASFNHVDISRLPGLNQPDGMRHPLLENLMKEVDVVFHMACLARVQPSIDDPILYNKVNVDGTLNVLKAAVDAGVKRVVFSSSSSVYGETDKLPSKETDELNPISPYAAQKEIGEVYCKLFSQIYGLETVSLRYFNVYGDRMSLDGAYKLVIPIFTEQKLNGNPLTINGDGEQKRDFTYVGDVVRANIAASLSDKVGMGEVINIGNGDNRSVNQIADMIGGEKINREAVQEPRETLADINLAKQLLHWTPSGNIEGWMKTYKKNMGLDEVIQKPKVDKKEKEMAEHLSEMDGDDEEKENIKVTNKLPFGFKKKAKKEISEFKKQMKKGEVTRWSRKIKK